MKLQDQNLNRNLGDLQEGTKARNRVFQKRIVSMLFISIN